MHKLESESESEVAVEVIPKWDRARGLESIGARGRPPKVADRDLRSRSMSLGRRSRTRAAVGTFVKEKKRRLIERLTAN